MKNRREILTSQFDHISFVRFLPVICIFKILNCQCWSDGVKFPVLFWKMPDLLSCFCAAWRVVVSGSFLGSVVWWYQCLLWSLVGGTTNIYCWTAGKMIKGWNSSRKGCLHWSAKEQCLRSPSLFLCVLVELKHHLLSNTEIFSVFWFQHKPLWITRASLWLLTNLSWAL